MKLFSMFSGIGGFENGFKKADEKTEFIGYSEIDKYAIQVYEKHFPGVKNYGDARRIIPKDLPDFDILTGGFPCTSFSIAGKRRGFEDTRGTLFFEIARIVSIKRPKLLLLENVKGLLNHNVGKTFHTILSSLDELGYICEWQVCNSKNFGVPQNRERVFIVGHLRGISRSTIFPIWEGNEVSTESREKGKTPNQLATTITQNLKRGVHSGGETLIQVGTVDTKGNNSLWGRVYDTNGISKTLMGNAGGGGAKTGLYCVASRGRNMVDGKRKDILHAKTKQRLEINYNGTTNCLTGVQKDNWITEYKGSGVANIRRLTPKECERLQGFPDNWTAEGIDSNGKIVKISDSQRYKMCGNAVTTNVITAIAKRIKEVYFK